jgi:hypothetical protein
MGFNPPSIEGMGVNDRLLGPDKHQGAINNNNSVEPKSPFPTMPFFLPSLNGYTAPNIGNNTEIVSMASSGDRSHRSETPFKPQSEGGFSNRNSKFFKQRIKSNDPIRSKNGVQF